MTIQTLLATDGATVTYDPDGLWKTWNIDEVYMGGVGLNKHVPKVVDHLKNPRTNQTYIVTALDPATLIPTYEEIGAASASAGELLSSGVGANPDTYRAYLDATVVPHVLNIDARLKVGSGAGSYAKIFKGTNISPSGKVISMIFDQSGNFITNNIPLVLVALDTHENHTWKSVGKAYTNESMADGEMITVVIYDAEGHEIARRVCWVNNSTFVAGISADQRYVSHIALESPFISPTDESLLEYPINIPIQALNLFGRVYFSDNSSTVLPVDGTKFSLLGLGRFVGTYTGQKVPLVLRYKFDANETAYESVSQDGAYMSEPYSLVTTEQRGAFTIKLSGYPVWRTDLNEYRMRWFMSDLNRDVMFDVTPYVYYNQSSDVFSGSTYGVVQNLSIRVNMKDVSAALPSYIHTQTQSIVLVSAGTVQAANWKVAFEVNQEPLFGENLFAMTNMINQNLWRINVRSGITQFSDWLNRTFYDSKPLHDSRKEVRAPEPTHMVFFNGDARSEVPIVYWNQDFTVSTNLTGQNNVQIEFIRRTSQGDLRLGVVCMPLHHT